MKGQDSAEKIHSLWQWKDSGARKDLLILDTVYVILPLDAVDYILKREAIRTIPAECQAVLRPGNTAMEKAAEVIISLVTRAAVTKVSRDFRSGL